MSQIPCQHHLRGACILGESVTAIGVGLTNDENLTTAEPARHPLAKCGEIMRCYAAVASLPGGGTSSRRRRCEYDAGRATVARPVRRYGSPFAIPGSSSRPRPGRPAAEFTEPDVVGPMQKSDASVGFDTSSMPMAQHIVRGT